MCVLCVLASTFSALVYIRDVMGEYVCDKDTHDL